MEENINLEQETEIIKSLREDFENKLAEQKNSYEQQLQIMRAEHGKQLREILRTGTFPEKEEVQKAEEIDEVEAEVARISAKYKKQ